jgi:hypothetical protein
MPVPLFLLGPACSHCATLTFLIDRREQRVTYACNARILATRKNLVLSVWHYRAMGAAWKN